MDREALRTAFLRTLVKRGLSVERFDRDGQGDGIDRLALFAPPGFATSNRSVFSVDWTTNPPVATSIGHREWAIETVRACLAEVVRTDVVVRTDRDPSQSAKHQAPMGIPAAPAVPAPPPYEAVG
jgi:hypothetical protein